jgi:hypothetical protein
LLRPELGAGEGAGGGGGGGVGVGAGGVVAGGAVEFTGEPENRVVVGGALTLTT